MKKFKKVRKKYQFFIYLRFFSYFCTKLKHILYNMYKRYFIIGWCWLMLMFFSACGQKTEHPLTDEHTDTVPDIVAQIQQCSRLYTTEYQIHKIVACQSNREIKGMGMKLSLDIFGDRKMIIPMDATLKGYIDFSRFTEANIERRGEHLTITLPDPEVMLTATKIDQEGVKQFVTGFRDHFSDAEQTAFEAQGRQAIIAEIPRLGIEQSARIGAVRLLVPLLVQMGFQEQDITINFRTDFSTDDLIRTLN